MSGSADPGAKVGAMFRRGKPLGARAQRARLWACGAPAAYTPAAYTLVEEAVRHESRAASSYPARRACAPNERHLCRPGAPAASSRLHPYRLATQTAASPVKAAPLVPGPRSRSRLVSRANTSQARIIPEAQRMGSSDVLPKITVGSSAPPTAHMPANVVSCMRRIRLPFSSRKKPLVPGCRRSALGKASGTKRNRHAGAHMRLLCIYRAGRSTARRDAVWP